MLLDFNREGTVTYGIVVVVALLLVLPGASAGEVVSVREAIDLALAKNHLLRAATAEQDAAAAQVAVSRSRYFPNLTFELGAVYSDSPTQVFMMKLNQGRFTQSDFLLDNLNHPSPYGDFRTAVGLVQPLYDSSISRGQAVAEREQAERSFARERQRQEVAFTVYRACLEVQRARFRQEVAEQALAGAREHLRLAEVREEAGTGLTSDALRARTFLAEMEEQRITATHDGRLARLRLGRAVGGPPGMEVDLAGYVAPLPVTQSTEEVLQQALRSRPELREVTASREKGDAAVRLAKGAYLPTVYGTALYEMHDRNYPFGNDNDAWLVGVALRWELFAGLRSKAELERARALQRVASEQEEQLRAEIPLQVEEAWLRRQEAEQRREVARHAQRDAEETVRLISRRFDNSLATLVDLLDAQTALNRTRLRLVDNESDLAQATARLYLAAGTFLQEVAQ